MSENSPDFGDTQFSVRGMGTLQWEASPHHGDLVQDSVSFLHYEFREFMAQGCNSFFGLESSV